LLRRGLSSGVAALADPPRGPGTGRFWSGLVDDAQTIDIDWITPLEVSFTAPVALTAGTHRLRLDAVDAELVMRCDRIEAKVRATAVIEPPSQTTAAQLLALVHEGLRSGSLTAPTRAPLDREVIEDPERIAELFTLFRKRESCIRLRPVLDPRQVVDGRWHQGGIYLAPLAAGWSASLALECETEGAWSVYRYRADGFASAANAPTRVERVRHRVHRRVAAPLGVLVRARHPLWPDVAISGELVDVGFGGFAFTCDTARHMLFTGLELALEVAWRGQSIPCHAIVRHVCARGQVARCGVEVIDARARWWPTVDRLMHRSTAVGVADPETLWEIYTSSGYFALSGKQPDEFDPQRLAFAAANRRLAEAPELGGCFVYRTPDRVLAAISQLQTWPGAWLVYQLGRAEDRPLHMVGVDVLGDLYVHAYEHLAQYGQPRWLVNYVQDAAVWSKRIHLEVPARYIASGRASVTPFRAIEYAAHEEGQVPPGLDIGPATEAELEQLAAHAAAIRPAPYVQATGMDVLKLPAEFSRAWSRHGLVRARAILVARRAGKAIAAAVVDSTTRGLHLFRLTEACRMWWLESDGYTAAVPLLRAVSRWFRGRGSTHFVMFWENAEAAPSGGRDLGGATLSVLDAIALPELVEDVFANTARMRVRGIAVGEGR